MTTPSTRAPVGLIAVAVAIVGFALSTPLVKWSGVTGVVIAFWRMWMSVATWWIVLSVMRWRSRRAVAAEADDEARDTIDFPDRRAWKLVAPAGLCFGLNISLLFTAVTRTSIAHAEFIGSMTPLLVVPLGAALFGERPNLSALRFGMISVIGVAIVLFFGPATGVATVEGDLIMIGTLIAWASYLLFTKRARAAGLGTLTFMACMMPLGLITTVPLTVVLAGGEIFEMTGRGWFVAATLTIVTGMVAHGSIAFAQQHLPIATITIMQISQPGLAVLFAFVILGEEVRGLQIVGMALVITGIVLFTRRAQRRRVAPPVGQTAQPV